MRIVVIRSLDIAETNTKGTTHRVYMRSFNIVKKNKGFFCSLEVVKVAAEKCLARSHVACLRPPLQVVAVTSPIPIINRQPCGTHLKGAMDSNIFISDRF